MKRASTLFLQAVIVLIGLIALFLLVRLPLTEGRAANLDVFSIYTDPLILYGYAASCAFFFALYKAFRLLGYVGQDSVFSTDAVQALKSIKYCAILLGIMIVGAGIYISISHPKDDDAAGAISLSIMTSFIAIVVATAAAIFEKILQNALNLKSENDLTI